MAYPVENVIAVLPTIPATECDCQLPSHSGIRGVMKKSTLRSQEWFGKEGKDGIIYRAWMKNQGFPPEQFEGKPVVGICNTWSELTPCNAHFRELAQSIKNGVYEAGGFPLEFPVMSLGETLLKPTAMLFRNLAAMTVEESIRGNPIDGVVLLCGCDKTTPSLVMGAASVDLPTIVLSGGPMLTGLFRGNKIGTSDVWRFNDECRVGRMSADELMTAENGLCRSSGHCAVMGTASTMACMVESLGLSLPGNAATPAVSSQRKVLAHYTGAAIVRMIREDMRISKILTREAFENAIMVNAAIGGSTNFAIHLIAIARRIGVELTLDDIDRVGRDIPLLANLQPSGEHFMADFYEAGGLPALINKILPRIHRDSITVNGCTIGENTAAVETYNPDVITSPDKPFNPFAGIVVLHGNLCEGGAVIKPSAATPKLMKHRGKAVVFESIENYKERVDDPNLEIDASSVMVLKNVGPKGYPGMPEVGNMALPRKILKQGITDMVRISDGRMSGTGFGTVVLHVSPEAAVGGTLAIVQNGDEIELDVEARTLTLHVPAEEIARRKKEWTPPPRPADRGYASLYIDHVEQANLGADFDFLTGCSGSTVTRDSH